ncbi:MAG: hypothetical protein KA072_12805, partial [Thermoanaerobaculaceae bacterium]|nr:hypothetical protein [Thermoanaerobaculaceae bacterium]
MAGLFDQLHRREEEVDQEAKLKVLGLDLTVGGFPGSRGPEFGERGTGSGDDTAGEGDQGEGGA